MRFADLKARYDKVREGETTVEPGVTLKWRIPTEGDMRRLAAAAGGNQVTWGISLVVEALYAWSGVKVSHLYPDDPDISGEPLDFSPDAARALLNMQVDWLDVVTLGIMAAYDARRERLAAERKKPGSA